MERKLTAKRKNSVAEAPVNPMEGIANLADVMLVLAVGIMLALVINWNVDLAVVSAANKTEAQIDRSEALTFEEDDIRPADMSGDPEGAEMKKLGVVYYDESTGTYYLMESEE
ncbi:MAG: DUF2149 domain-containing protein [Peptococcaceae bacterium]|jgi:hypothetical protein|nr:DUF2149 domain-containing protein [Peptococcaceae bacterium]